MEFDTNWRSESRDILFKLTTGYLKRISSHIEQLLGWLYGLILNNYPVTYSFHGVFLEQRYQNVTWNFIQNWRIEPRDILFKLTTGYLKSISSHIEYLLGWLYGLILNNYPVTYSFHRVFFEPSIKMLHGIWYKIGGLNQEISYSNLPQVFSIVFEVI